MKKYIIFILSSNPWEWLDLKISEMKKIIILLLMVLFFNNAISQTTGPKNRIGISVPVVWNNSKEDVESNDDFRGGKAFSYGVNIHYMHSLSRSFYVMTGIGYFKQQFDIRRHFLFDFDNPDRIQWPDFTSRYSYETIPVLFGAGYQKMFNNHWRLSGQLTYNIYSSISQKYIRDDGVVDKYHRYIDLGNTFHLDAGFSKDINKRISIRGGIILPLLVRWHKDGIFSYSEDNQKIAQNIFSIGTSLSCYYSF